MNIDEKISNNWYLEQDEIQTLIKRYKIMKYLNYLFAIAITVLLLSCADNPTLSNPEPCAEYKFTDIQYNTAYFERDDVTIRLKTMYMDNDQQLEVGQVYTLCGGGTDRTYIKN